MDSTSTHPAPSETARTGDAATTALQKSIARRFLELVRFSHTIFALPFAALAVVMALAIPTPSDFSSSGLLTSLRIGGVLLCMVSARSAAMAFNRLVDAKLDADNPRTKQRHIPAGELSSLQVWMFFAFMVVLFEVGCLAFWPNWLPLALSLPVLAWICGYSLAKRFTAAAHLWLGIALALSPVCAWIGMRGEIVAVSPADVLPSVVLAVAIAVWVTGFDIIYACQDEDYDRAAGLFSVPARFGTSGALRIAAGLHLVMLCVLAALPLLFPQLSLGWLYWSAWAAVAALVARQHWIVSPQDLRRVGEAFFTINAIISLGFCTAAAIDCALL